MISVWNTLDLVISVRQRMKDFLGVVLSAAANADSDMVRTWKNMKEKKYETGVNKRCKQLICDLESQTPP